jgi:hypothetical protein
MRIAKTSLVALALLLLAAPTALAKGEDDCVSKVVELCDAAEAAMFQEAFGEWGDIVLAFVALFVVALVLNLLIWLVFRLKIRRLLRLTVADKVREVEPGGTVRYKMDVENLQGRYPVEVFLEHDGLPTGWESKLSASVVLPSGFRMPQEVGELNSFVLSSAARGSNSALVELKATAPTDVTTEETVETEVRVMPVVRGHLKKRSSKKAGLTILLVPHLPKVQILKVTHRPERISVGHPVMTTATVVNKGEREARDVAVSFTLNGSEMDKKVVPALAVQGAADVEFNWTPQTGENKIRVAVAT